jgi:RND family efflux transporter MFP subunit
VTPANRLSRNADGIGKIIIVVIVAAAIIITLLVLGLIPRFERKKDLDKATSETTGALPVVRTIVARPANETEQLVLPANIGAIQYTTIYARVDGYLSGRLVDIGDKVKKGQLLAVIETPTIDQELEQARADLLRAKAAVDQTRAQTKEAVAQKLTAQANVQKAKANVDYATVTATRWTNLATRGAVSLQSRDEKVRFLDTTSAELTAQGADVKAADAKIVAAQSQIAESLAEVKAKQAQVKRLEVEQSFQKVLAPFDGIITLRKVDPGALITKGSQSNNLELYQMARIDRLRVYISAPQRVARYLKAGQAADIMVPEYPERKFTGIVTNVSGALDPSTRTRQTEVQIDNKDHALLPGMYAEIKLTGAREGKWIRVPGTTLVTRPNGQYVVVVKDGKAHYQPIVIGRDFGNQVEVKQGLTGDEHVAVSPNDDLIDGEGVQEQPLETDKESTD